VILDNLQECYTLKNGDASNIEGKSMELDIRIYILSNAETETSHVKEFRKFVGHCQCSV
jgi:hypothetical protein